MKRSILALGVLMAFSAPVSAGEYYIVHGQDRHCNVVESVPEGHDFIRVGPLSFGTRDEAESQVKVICSDNGYYRDQERREEHRDR